MRLAAQDAQVIREEVLRRDSSAEIYLFGSRTDDSVRGGDIDVLVISDQIGFRELLQLRARILDQIGWQQLDLIIRRRDEADEPLAAMARHSGIKL